jgi:hypothetical protein
MPTAYVLINYEIGAERNILNKLKDISGVTEASEVNGVYDIVVKISSDSIDRISISSKYIHYKPLTLQLVEILN